MGRAHAAFEMVGGDRVALKGEQARCKRLRLGSELDPEEIEHGEVAEVLPLMRCSGRAFR